MAGVLLANPMFLAHDEAERVADSPYFPLGLLYLAASIRRAGHSVSIFDGTFAAGPSDFDDQLATEAPDVVGISALITTRPTVLDLARRAADADVPVVVGGPDATAFPEIYLAEPSVTLVIGQEGEDTMNRVLDLLDNDRLDTDALRTEPGVAFRDHGLVVVNEARAPIEDLDDLPLPARDLIDMDRYLEHWQNNRGYRSITVATSRGCPDGCRWCDDAAHGGRFRQRSAAGVAQEVAALAADYDIDRLRLVDDVDSMDGEWLAEWASEANARDAVVPFEPLNAINRSDDIAMLDVQDTL